MLGNSVGGDCVGMCGCEGDGGMPLGLMMEGFGVGVGNEGDVVGACGHRVSPSTKMHKETSTVKGDPSLGFVVTSASGARCGQSRALAGPGTLSGGHHNMYAFNFFIFLIIYL